MVTAATSLAGTEVRRGRVLGLGPRLELGLGAFESWEDGEQYARSGGSTGARERRGRRQWRRLSSGSMAKWATEQEGDHAMAWEKQKLTVVLTEVVARSGSFCGRSI